MPSPNLPAELQTACDEVDMAQRTLKLALDDALHSAVHSTYTAAIQRIISFNQQTMRSLKALLTDLRRDASHSAL